MGKREFYFIFLKKCVFQLQLRDFVKRITEITEGQQGIVRSKTLLNIEK